MKRSTPAAMRMRAMPIEEVIALVQSDVKKGSMRFCTASHERMSEMMSETALIPLPTICVEMSAL